MRLIPFALSLALLAVTTEAVAAGSLPLAHGTYVLRGTACADAPFAAMRSFDGIGLGDPHSHACRVRVLSRRGATFSIANSCINAGVGPAPRSTERLVLTIRTPRTFAIAGSTYRLCPRLP